MAKERRLFDYFDRCPFVEDWREYAKLAEAFNLPIGAGNGYYTLGRDESVIEKHIRESAALGAGIHNFQIMMDHADGRLVSDEEVSEILNFGSVFYFFSANETIIPGKRPRNLNQCS